MVRQREQSIILRTHFVRRESVGISANGVQLRVYMRKHVDVVDACARIIAVYRFAPLTRAGFCIGAIFIGAARTSRQYNFKFAMRRSVIKVV